MLFSSAGPQREVMINKDLMRDLKPDTVGSLSMDFMTFTKHVGLCKNYAEENNIGDMKMHTQMSLASKLFEANMVTKVEAKVYAKAELSTITFSRMMTLFR